MAIKLSFTSPPVECPCTDGIIGVPLPEAKQMIGVNEAATRYKGYTFMAGQGMAITYNSLGILFESTGSVSSTTITAGSGITVTPTVNGVELSASGGDISMEDLADVYLPTQLAGDVLAWSSAHSQWRRVSDSNPIIIESRALKLTRFDNRDVSGTILADALSISSSYYFPALSSGISDSYIYSSNSVTKYDTKSGLTSPSIDSYWAGAGLTPSGSISGSASRFELTVTTSTGCVSGLVLTIDTGYPPFPKTPEAVFSAKNSSASLEIGKFYIQCVDSRYINVYAASALSDGTQYKLSFIAIG